MATIDLFFAGLIAFVSGEHGWTAYVVDMNVGCDHSAKLQSYGKVTRDGDNFCWDMSGGVSCDLDLVETIEIATLTGAQYFETKPDKKLPESIAEGKSEKWMVRMKDVYQPASKVKDPQELNHLVGAMLKFNWDQVRSCHLEELGKGNIYAYLFKYGATETAFQAIAESVLFTSNVNGNSATIVMKNLKGEKDTLTLDCSSGKCPVVLVQNTASSSCSTKGHFVHYYDLSKGPVEKKPIPEQRGAAKFQKDVSDQCKDELASIKDHFKQSGSSKLVSWWATKRLFAGIYKIQDRIVCPPVVFEP